MGIITYFIICIELAFSEVLSDQIIIICDDHRSTHELDNKNMNLRCIICQDTCDIREILTQRLMSRREKNGK